MVRSFSPIFWSPRVSLETHLLGQVFRHRSEPLHQVLAYPDYVAGRQLETTETVFVFLLELQTKVREDFTLNTLLSHVTLLVDVKDHNRMEALRIYANQNTYPL